MTTEKPMSDEDWAERAVERPMIQDELQRALRQLTVLCGVRAENNGWNSDFPQREDFAEGVRGNLAYHSAVRNWDAVKVSLLASEAFEAQDELRKGKDPDETYYPTSGKNVARDMSGDHKPEGVPSEIADILVRVFHYCHFREVPLADIFFEKLDYNDRRGARHGGKGF